MDKKVVTSRKVAPGVAAALPPNILFIFPDQWRGDSLSCLGHPLAETPFLDGLTAQGTLFTSAYSNSPTCIPARACLITGQTPAATGRHGYRDGVCWPYPHTLMRCLRDHGYQTLMAGKTHFHPARAHLGFEQVALYDNQRLEPGFKSDYDRWLEHETGGRIQDTAQQLNSNSMLVQPWTHDESLHANSWTVTAAIEMLEHRDPTRPFFIQLGFHRPHPPLDPPAEYWRRFENAELPEVPIGDWVTWGDQREWRIDHGRGHLPARLLDRARRAYYAQLNHLDFQIGRLLRWLQLRRMEAETMVVFSSDHGEHLGEHHLFRKSTALDVAARIPLLIRLPASSKAPAGARRGEPVALYDIMPTLLEAAGCPPPPGIEGRSLLPLASGCEVRNWREYVHVEHNASALGPYQAVTDGRMKYIWNTLDGNDLLFDLIADPHECHNLADDPRAAKQLKLWRRRLLAEIRRYEADGLVKHGRLQPGQVLPTVRDGILAEAGRADVDYENFHGHKLDRKLLGLLQRH